ncbi:MAG: Rieske 2Fe-2S domain-containing protein [Nitrospirota bacterium]
MGRIIKPQTASPQQTGERILDSSAHPAAEEGHIPANARREFLKSVIKKGFTLLAVLFGFVTLRFLYPAKIKEPELRYYALLPEEELPREGIKKAELTYKKNDKTITLRIFLVGHGDRQFALSSSCSHLGCLVSWSYHKNLFICPCHGGTYDIEGNVVSGPPPLPLSRLPLKVQDGKAFVGIRV